MDRSEILLYCIGWATVAGAISLALWRSRASSVGLCFAYLVSFTLVHFGACIYVFPRYIPENDPYLYQLGANVPEVAEGLRLAFLGLVCLAAGILWAGWTFSPPIRSVSEPPDQRSVNRLSRTCMLAGCIFYFIVLPVAHYIPSGTSLAAAGIFLVLTGICLTFWNSRSNGRIKLSTLALPLALPLVTLICSGFIGYGISALVIVGAFFIQFFRVRFAFVLSLVPLVYLGLTVYVNYMESRNDIRETVWGNQAYSARMNVILDKSTTFEPFDPQNAQHLYLIDRRLNQNLLVGKAVRAIESGRAATANGKTLAFAFVSWIPRAIWPSKPAVGGSGDIVSRYTGLRFAEHTSVGLGQVLEFYINFGAAGVMIGFFVLGFALRRLDIAAATRLMEGNVWKFAGLHLIGIALIQPGGSMSEIVAGVAAAFVLVKVLEHNILRRSRRRQFSVVNKRRPLVDAYGDGRK